jgi:flagellar basal body-associated protein FliL
MKKIIIIIAAVLLVGGGAAFILLSPKPVPEPKTSLFKLGDSFITNIKDSKSLLKTTIEIEYDSTEKAEDKAAFLAEKNTVMRDSIIILLSGKTEAELRSQDIQDKLRSETIVLLEQKLGVDYLKTVYFDDFVLQ